MQPLDVSAYPPARQWAAQRINEYIAGQEKTKACLDCALVGIGDWRVRADVEALRSRRADECARRYQERQRVQKTAARPASKPAAAAKATPVPRPVEGARQWWQEGES
jgi:hypothetical protein